MDIPTKVERKHLQEEICFYKKPYVANVLGFIAGYFPYQGKDYVAIVVGSARDGLLIYHPLGKRFDWYPFYWVHKKSVKRLQVKISDFERTITAEMI